MVVRYQLEVRKRKNNTQEIRDRTKKRKFWCIKRHTGSKGGMCVWSLRSVTAWASNVVLCQISPVAQVTKTSMCGCGVYGHLEALVSVLYTYITPKIFYLLISGQYNVAAAKGHKINSLLESPTCCWRQSGSHLVGGRSRSGVCRESNCTGAIFEMASRYLATRESEVGNTS